MKYIFKLTSDYIELNKLLKLQQLVDTWSDAKKAILAWLVSVNGSIEHRIRNKLIAGSIVEYNGATVVVEKQ